MLGRSTPGPGACCVSEVLHSILPQGLAAALEREEKGRERQESPTNTGNTLCLLAKSSQEVLGRRESFCSPGEGRGAAEKIFLFHTAAKTSDWCKMDPEVRVLLAYHDSLVAKPLSEEKINSPSTGKSVRSPID